MHADQSQHFANAKKKKLLLWKTRHSVHATLITPKDDDVAEWFRPDSRLPTETLRVLIPMRV